jgi:radical SAM superfamily enzyme YgiQ (UPF0313 family)
MRAMWRSRRRNPAQARGSRAQPFHLILIKPSHYDDDGYVIQWARSSVPSNSMAAIYGLALDCIDRQVLGPDRPIEVAAYDETNTRIRVDRIASRIRAGGGHGLVALVGVQTNQFPRAVDLALELRARGVQACIGGFHVSGCLAMLNELPADLTFAMDSGISLFAGELEGRLDGLLRDAEARRLERLYDFTKEAPPLESQPLPYLPAPVIARMSDRRTSFDAGRGCPFLCSFCTIINVQGRTSRYRSPDDVETIVRKNLAQGIRKFFITDDNFVRNKIWEPIFDRLIEIREAEGIDLKLTVQVDTLCHKVPRFIEKAARAGVEKVFIGMESIDPDALRESRKTQNKITEYRRMLQAWHDADVVTCAGYILGFPGDTPEGILRDIGIIQRELPVDALEFFILVPLPGSQDHKELYERKVPLDPDMNRYDSVHVTAPHPRMTGREWVDVYRRAWDAYYSPEHVATVLRRARAWGSRAEKVMWVMLSFHATAVVEGVHPLDGGILRRKYRHDRRRGLPLESPLAFYPRYAWETVSKQARLLAMYLRYRAIYRRAVARSAADPAEDLAMQPVRDEELDRLDLFTATDAARAAALKSRRMAERKAALPAASDLATRA